MSLITALVNAHQHGSCNACDRQESKVYELRGRNSTYRLCSTCAMSFITVVKHKAPDFPFPINVNPNLPPRSVVVTNNAGEVLATFQLPEA